MCEIPEAVQCYLDLIDNDEEFPVCEEQKLLAAMVRRVLSEEDVHFDTAQLDKSLSYQKYFPYKLFEWERFVFALHNCLYRADGQLRFPEGFFNMGRGGGKNGYDAFENFCMMLPPCGVKEYNIYSISVLWAERWDAGYGNFKMSKDYPVNSFVSLGTHDMSPLKMWWFGYDISTSRELGIMASDEEMYNAYHKREADRWKLLKAMDEQSVWPEDNYRHGDYMYGEGYPEGLEEAAHRYMARTNAKVFLVQPEDVFQVDKLQNLPGTDRDKHPNWRRKLPVNIEDMAEHIAYKRNLTAVKKER